MAPDRSRQTHRLRPDTAETIRRTAAEVPHVSLLVYHREGVMVVPLAGAPLVIGRALPADVVIDDRSLSRRHARFALARGQVEVEDLGSTNGTLLHGQAVDHARLRPGDTVTLGGVLVTVHLRTPEQPAQLGLESHDRFRELLERELVRARHFDEEVAVIMVRAASPRAHVSGWLGRVLPELRAVDTVALYSEEAVEIELPRTGVAAAIDLAERIASGGELVCGVAAFPASATGVDQLLDACQQAARAAGRNEPVRSAPAIGTRALAGRPRSGAVVESAVTRELFDTVTRVARSPIPVLLVGETGSGKEVVARAIHERGLRSKGPMVCVNCGAIVAQLVESTLFGHERGAFTGASSASEGVFGAADGGTVFLDEIGELPPPAQAALLRVIEHKRVTRVGSTEEISIDVRVIAATHRDLEAMCEAGSFRRDLWYRLNAMTLWIPALRERIEELPALAEHFLSEATRESERPLSGITPEALECMRRYAWPGNLRELKNAIDRAVVIARGDRITLEDLPQRVRAVAAQASAAVSTDSEELDDGMDLRARVRRYEVRLIAAALERTDGNKTKAARLLKIPLRTLVHKIKVLGV